MPNGSRLFIILAIVYGILGFALGIWMGINQDFTYRHLHAHINLIGWASLALFGVIHHVYPELERAALARTHLVVAGLGAPIFPIGPPLADSGTTILLAVIGSLMMLASMVMFLVIFVRGTGAARARRRAA